MVGIYEKKSSRRLFFLSMISFIIGAEKKAKYMRREIYSMKRKMICTITIIRYSAIPFYYRKYLMNCRSCLVLFLLFSSLAHAGKDEFIENILPEIHKAKAEMGGQAREVPNSLIIAQAGLESGWGTSTITKTKNNILGLTKGGKKYASFESLKDGFKYYLKALTTNPLHEDFRDMLEITKNPLRLISSLGSYAEDVTYQMKLRQIIVQNNLRRFDA